MHRNALVALSALRELELRQSDATETIATSEGWGVSVAPLDEWLSVSRRQVSAAKAALNSRASQRLPVLSGVPQPQNPDGIGLYLVTHLVVTHDQPAHLTVAKVWHPLAQARMGLKMPGPGFDLIEYQSCRPCMAGSQKSMQPNQIGERFAGPDYAHVGGGNSWSVPRLAIQASTSL